MGIKTYNPYTPSRRNMTGSDFSEITKSTPEKSLLVSLSKNSGRNNQGKITVRHRGGGNRKKYRLIDFKRNKEGVPAKVIGIEYDPNRTANIALICYADGEKSYILAPEGLTDGMTVMNGPKAEVRVGNCLPLSEIPVGTQIHNIELYPGKGGQLVRSAGNSAQLMAKDQVITDRTGSTILNPSTDIDKILDDLGYTANDLLNVSFVFIVEGKQDRNRLPLLLKKYYSEIVDENGHLNRVAIIATNSCTNIKTHANLKYINSLYLKDAFLMIRDSDGKNPQMLKDQLCGYYRAREHEDTGTIPRVTDRNVLILKYYSFENYFLDPKVMAKIGVIKNEQQFYDILYAKYTEYLYKLKSMRNMQERFKIKIDGPEDIKDNLEKIRIYVRGHNLYDIFYGRYKGDKEPDILTKYIEEAPRETFADILDAIDDFVYFNSHSADVKG